MTTGLVGKPPRAARQVVRSTDLRAGLTGGLVSAGESRWRREGLPRPPDAGRQGLGLRSPAGRYQPAERGQRPGQPPAD